MKDKKNNTFSYDTITTIGGSVIQHGHNNERVYIMRLDPDTPQTAIERSVALAKEKGYGKIFAKVPARGLSFFLRAGFTEEACISRSALQGGDIFFMSLFIDRTRAEIANEYPEGKSFCGRKSAFAKSLPPSWSLQLCSEHDSEEMAEVFGNVFSSYPFPINRSEYIVRSMNEGIRYYCLKDGHNRIVALSSAECDISTVSAEMSDFATLPEARGMSCATHLLKKMESDIVSVGIKTPYTIARAVSSAVNKLFAGRNYRFAGTLRNNTQMCGTLEDMNVWFKNIG